MPRQESLLLNPARALTLLRRERLFWGLGVGLIFLSLFAALASHKFSYDYRVAEMPLLELLFFLLLMGGGFLILRALLPLKSHSKDSLKFIILIFLIGFVARGIMLFSEPVLEDDYQRYLWDGGVLAAGLDPYLYSPKTVLEGGAPFQFTQLHDNAYPIVERINHPELRTIYPPGAEGAFALAHFISPWSLTAWRGLILVMEGLSFLLAFGMLSHFGRHFSWITLYWWNPLVIKELINSAHMEAVLMPLLLGGLYLMLVRRLMSSSLLIALATSVKFWPALLLPLIWRQMLGQPLKLLLSFLIALLIGGVTVWPYLSSGLNESSGLVAYAQNWTTNSFIFPLIEMSIGALLSMTDVARDTPFIARGAVGLFLIFMLFYFIRHDRQTGDEIFHHAFRLCLLIFLLSPAQFPWYFLWVAPFLPFYPLAALCLMVPMMSVYYFGFYLMVHDLDETWRFPLVAMSWILPLMLLLFEFKRAKERGLAS